MTVTQSATVQKVVPTVTSPLISKSSLRTPDFLVQSAWHEHAAFLFWLMDTLRPRCFVELGTHYGYSYFAACQAVQEFGLDTKCYAIDHWRGDEHAGFYGDDVFDLVQARNSFLYSGFSQLLRSKFDEATSYFADFSIDLLHIDGRHFYEDVLHDFMAWRPKLTSDAIILFHDTDVREREFGVWKLFAELSKEHLAFEFKHNYGLGVVALGMVPTPLEPLFAADDNTIDLVRGIYATLGGMVSLRWNYETTLTRLRHRLDDIRNEGAQHRRELRAALADERLQNKRLAADLERVNRARNRLASSLSWRITAPVRSTVMGCRSGARIVINAAQRISSACRGGRTDQQILNDSGLFDEALYLRNSPDAIGQGTPVQHYLTRGWREGRRPHALFDGDWYRRQNPDVVINPLVHFLKIGRYEYRDPNPFFNMRWYTAMNPDVALSGLDPLTHFIRIGAARLADPSPAFNISFYLDQNPDVAEARLNPLAHYLSCGQREGRLPCLPPPNFASSRPVTAARLDCRKSPAVRSEMALLVAHSPDGHLRPHVREYLKALAREGIGVVLIVAADQAFVEDDPALYQLVDGLFVRSNEGLDFAAWAHLLRLHPEFYRAQTLYLLNDSVIGPVSDASFHTAIARVRGAPADLVGMTDNYERGWHIQSYFLALKRGALRSYAWHRFVLDIVSFIDKYDVINSYEVQLAPTLTAMGLSALVLFKAKSRHNPTAFHWKELLDEGFPFIKVATIRDEIPGVDRSGWRELLNGFGFDVTIVDEILAGKRIERSNHGNAATTQGTRTMPAVPRQPTRVAFIGPWNYDNGLGVGSRGYLTALMRTRYANNFLPIKRPFHIHQRIGTSVEFRTFVGPPDVAVVHLNAESWDPLLTDAQREAIRSAPRKIGAFIWESRELPSLFETRFREIDAIWAPTSYCTEIFQSATSLPVHTVHFPVDVKERRRSASEIAEVKKWLGLRVESKLVLFAFDASSYLARKNPFSLVAAFQKTNLSAAGWRLILKMKHSTHDAAGIKVLRAMVDNCPGAHIIDRPVSDEAMAVVMETADIYASPHSSEGFGLSIAEAMALGKVVVATDFGGSRDFLGPETGFPVRWVPWQTDRDDGAYGKGTIWARVDEDHLAESLLAAATLSDEEKRRIGERARRHVRDTLSPDAVCTEMHASIDSVLAL
jgi:glycosyltransferase involved in cell wall biosynthesis